MTKEKYLEQRNALMAEIESLIAEGKLDESNAKMEEVKELDNKWEQVKLANANLNALKGNKVGIDLENKGVELKGEVTEVETVAQTKTVDQAAVYEVAWAKTLQGKKLEDSEQAVFDKINAEFRNAYTHDTGNTPTLIPQTVVAGIWKRAEEMYPLLADIKKYNVRGTLVMNKHTSIAEGDAAWYDEDTATVDEKNVFGQITLTGCELAKAITVTWKLRSMATEEFIPYIKNELASVLVLRWVLPLLRVRANPVTVIALSPNRRASRLPLLLRQILRRLSLTILLLILLTRQTTKKSLA